MKSWRIVPVALFLVGWLLLQATQPNLDSTVIQIQQAEIEPSRTPAGTPVRLDTDNTVPIAVDGTIIYVPITAPTAQAVGWSLTAEGVETNRDIYLCPGGNCLPFDASLPTPTPTPMTPSPTPLNPPIARADEFTVDVLGEVTITRDIVLANDSRQDVQIVFWTMPTVGAYRVSGDTVRWVAPLEFSDDVQLVYTIQDDHGLRAAAIVVIHPYTPTPTVTPSPTTTPMPTMTMTATITPTFTPMPTATITPIAVFGQCELTGNGQMICEGKVN